MIDPVFAFGDDMGFRLGLDLNSGESSFRLSAMPTKAPRQLVRS
jgi:hypothetical protein